MDESDKRKFGYYFFIVFSLVCFFINAIIAYSKYTESSSIRNNSYDAIATVVKEEQNYFGGNKSYKYLLKYSFDNVLYQEFELGIHEHNYYQINQKIEIIINKKEPNVFVIKDEINQYKNYFIISLVSLLLFIILIRFKSRIVF